MIRESIDRDLRGLLVPESHYSLHLNSPYAQSGVFSYERHSPTGSATTPLRTIPPGSPFFTKTVTRLKHGEPRFNKFTSVHYKLNVQPMQDLLQEIPMIRQSRNIIFPSPQNLHDPLTRIPPPRGHSRSQEPRCKQHGR